MNECVKLGTIIQQVRGVSYKPTDVRTAGDPDAIALLRANNIQDDGLNFDELVYVDKKKVNAEQMIKKGDIVICSSSGSKNLVGKAAVADSDLPYAFGAFCKVVRVTAMNALFVGQYFQSPRYRREISASSAGANINNIRNEHIDELLIPVYPESDQIKIAQKLLYIDRLIHDQQAMLVLIDQLVKSRFIELFGDPITNSKCLPTNNLGKVLLLKAGDFTAASDIAAEPTTENIYPCYGGNGIRGYVAEYNQEGSYSLIGRQGALSGNVQYATGKFKNTEHALLVTPLIEMNSIWLNHLLINLDLQRYQTGAAQPGLSVKNLQEIPIIEVPKEDQNQFAAFVEQTDKSKFLHYTAIQCCRAAANLYRQEWMTCQTSVS